MGSTMTAKGFHFRIKPIDMPMNKSKPKYIPVPKNRLTNASSMTPISIFFLEYTILIFVELMIFWVKSSQYMSRAPKPKFELFFYLLQIHIPTSITTLK
jgi:hypothetical protein